MLCYNVESKMLAKLIEVVVKDYQFYITATSICIFNQWCHAESYRTV